MVSPLFFYQLVLFALIWLFVILHLTQTNRVVTAPDAPADPEPVKPKRPRSNESKPFEGLTQKPPCALCERDTAHPKRRLRCHLPPCPRRTDVLVRSTPPGTFVRMPVVITGDGSVWAICAPTGIPVVAPGGSSTVPLVKGTFWKRMAPSSTVNRRQSRSSCGSWCVWPKA
jgi:hypothetical protein